MSKAFCSVAVCVFLFKPCVVFAQGSQLAFTEGLPRHATLGVSVAPDTTGAGGVVIQAVTPGRTAALAGVVVGDRVIALNDSAVNDLETFLSRSAKIVAGQPVSFRIRRGEKLLDLRARAVARPFEMASGLTVDYGSVDAAHVRRRTITLRPRGPGRRPAVLIMGGLGCYSLDGLRENEGGYGTLIYGLARAGYTVTRVEKVGEGDSEGPSCDTPAADMKLDVAGYSAALRALRADPLIDTAHIAIVAHSMGPIEAALIADSIPVSALVLAETTGLSWFEYDLLNVRRQLALKGAPYDAMERSARLHMQCSYRFYILHETPAEIARTLPRCAQSLEFPQPYTYMQQVGDVDQASHWKNIDAPVLVIYGTSDFVTSEADSQYLVDMINSFHRGRASLRVINGMDHGLTRASSQAESYAGNSSNDAHPELLQAVVAFLDSTRQRHSAP